MTSNICENCGNQHDGSYGSGRFCSSHCRYSFISKQTKNRHAPRKSLRAKTGTWKCEQCNLIFETRQQLKNHNYENHPVAHGSSWNKGLTKNQDKRIAKYVQTNKINNNYNPWNKNNHLTIEHRNKISQSMKKFYTCHPELIPYKLHHSSKESYPEKYFNELFIKEHITGFKRNYYVGGYFLDFAFLKNKIDFEVDGSQHYVDPKIIEHDKIRTKYLETIGWNVVRLDWRKWQTFNSNQKYDIINQLKNLI